MASSALYANEKNIYHDPDYLLGLSHAALKLFSDNHSRNSCIKKAAIINHKLCSSIPEKLHIPLQERIGNSWGGGGLNDQRYEA